MIYTVFGQVRTNKFGAFLLPFRFSFLMNNGTWKWTNGHGGGKFQPNAPFALVSLLYINLFLLGRNLLIVFIFLLLNYKFVHFLFIIMFFQYLSAIDGTLSIWTSGM